ncbi:hypothetical protein [Salinigranum rubrum]|uniref:hypothetical protein n=1 Tax=Salinigranum rubrum TaxID=755307 RepID=UPI0013A53065|nr:hypothetical protein [Salinigranum rubrum]
MLIAGFVVGQGIHSVSKAIEELFGIPNHRAVVIGELAFPTIMPFETIERFYEECHLLFKDRGLPDLIRAVDREAQFETDTEYRELIDYNAAKTLEHLSDDESARIVTMYSYVRSHLHMYGSGRARSFQAIYAMCRSMWVVSGSLAGVYFMYGIFKANNVFTDRGVYPSHLGGVSIPPSIIVLGSVVVALSSYVVFREAMMSYKRNFARYFIIDFLTLRNAEVDFVLEEF